MASIAALRQDGLNFPDKHVVGSDQADGYNRRGNQSSHCLIDYLSDTASTMLLPFITGLAAPNGILLPRQGLRSEGQAQSNSELTRTAFGVVTAAAAGCAGHGHKAS